MTSVLLVDLTPWFEGDEADRVGVARRIDAALCESGFLLIAGHGVPDGLRDRIRELSRRFFALPEVDKERADPTP
jgi:isopenicillin N synthase-like dioxygenase